MKKLYVDDLLKSDESEDYSVDLIKKVKKMCTARGFNLTMFTSNSNDVLMSIPDIHGKCAKGTDLVNKSSQWNGPWE